MRLGVLDQSPLREGGSAADAVAETLDLARAAESLGYHRYWLAEHHGAPGFAGAAPEIMITRVAAATDRIRVGAGGVMLMHYSPFKVAELFRLLEVMFPGRIDLGLGRAPGSDQRTAQALAYGSPIGVDYLPNKIADLLAFLTDGTPSTDGFEGLRATPVPEGAPAPWMLGSTHDGAGFAAHFGLGFSLAHFINPHGGPDIVKGYRDNFRPSALVAKPDASLGVFVICADTMAEAERLAASRDLWRLRLETGRLDPFPSVETALAYPYTDAERRHVAANRQRSIVGDPAFVRARLTELAETHDVDELVVLTITYDHAARLRSYQLLAEAFDLQAPVSRAAE